MFWCEFSSVVTGMKPEVHPSTLFPVGVLMVLVSLGLFHQTRKGQVLEVL